MFTGLVEGLGQVAAIVPEAAGMGLTISIPRTMSALADTRIGDSVAINGCCLTIIALSDLEWSFQAGLETLSKTNLGRLQPGDAVNLERALPANARLGGHFVQGHVDGPATIAEIRRTGDWIEMVFALAGELARGLVPKGSIAVDGVSLTVVRSEAERFSVALIPHTLSATTLGVRQVGDVVNIETDILGKYVQKFLASR